MKYRISASDISIVSLLHSLLHGGRGNAFEDSNDRAVPLLILCSFGDHIKLCRAQQYSNAHALVEVLSRQYLHESSVSSACKEYLLDAVYCSSITSLDALLDFMGSLRLLFENPTDYQPNKVYAPTCVTNNSTLGIYLRSFLARWECMTFESICILYESLEIFRSSQNNNRIELTNAFNTDGAERANQSLPYDIGTSDDIVDIYPAPSVFSGEQQPLQKEPLFYLLNAQKAMTCLDFHAAEDSIHKFYDSGSSLLGPMQSINGAIVRGYGENGAKSAPAVAMEALVNSLTEPPFGNARHQQAMLALATAWTLGGYSQLAMSAIEEAMKTAHQRGDHAAVAKALLLLHVVATQDMATANVSAEEVLTRCLDKCAGLKLRSLSAQAVLLMVRYRARQLPRFQPRLQDELNKISTDQTSASALWNLWSCALVGDCHLSARISSGRTTVPHLTPATKDANSKADYPMSTSEAAVFIGSAALTAVDVWIYMGRADMAELQARRAIRQLGLYGTTAEIISLVCKLAYLHIEMAADMDQQQGQGTRFGLAACASGKSLLDHAKKMFPASSPSVQSDALFAARLYCCTFEAAAECQWEKALRLATRLADAHSIPLIATDSCSPQGQGQNSFIGQSGPLSVEQMKASELLKRIFGAVYAG